MTSYSEKLRDPRWQKVRLKVMERDGFKCLCCGSGDKPLNVHHLSYHGSPWESPLSELETLCEDCHETRSNIDKLLKSSDTKTLIDLFDIFGGLFCDPHRNGWYWESKCILLYVTKNYKQISRGMLEIMEGNIKNIKSSRHGKA